jgi:site-specific recombinase XerD
MELVPAVCGPVSVTALDRVLERYVDHLARERRLAVATIRHRRDVAQRFLADCAVGDEPDLKRLTAVDVRQFVLVKGRQGSIGQAKLIVVALRSLLRFLHLQGLIPTDLASAAPTIAGSRYSSLPRALEPTLVRRLLDSCDRRTSSGRRDYAVLTLLSRLGLRAGEVAAIELADIVWRHGEMMIRGKGQRQERLPLPTDVGEAVVAYIQRARPRAKCRRLFLRSLAPRGGLTAGAIAQVVRAACLRAGLPEMGAHRLRHTAATQMLRRGSSLAEIAQVLRHSSILTTTIYAKVDRDVLRTLAQPWPEVAP